MSEIKHFTESDVITTITENTYETYVDFTVTSKLGVHTFVNHAETRHEAEIIAASHKLQLLQAYTPKQEEKKKKKSVDSSVSTEFELETEE